MADYLVMQLDVLKVGYLVMNLDIPMVDYLVDLKEM
jgi:hypothetical protein